MIEYTEDIKKYDGMNEYSPIPRIMKRYELVKGDYEYSEYAAKLFEKLNWESSTKDIITPFWRIFTAALVYYSSKLELYEGKWRTDNVRPTYIFNNNTICYRTEFNKRDGTKGLPLSKKKIGTKYFEESTVHFEYVNAVALEFSELSLLAELTDSMANFAPCPDSPYNSLKGLLPNVCDFMNLMIDKIQSCIDNKVIMDVHFSNIKIHADIYQIRAWHDWFIDNRERYLFQDYFDIEGERLVGRELFYGQSLLKPLPMSYTEIQECIKNMLKIIRNRGQLMNSSGKKSRSVINEQKRSNV